MGDFEQRNVSKMCGQAVCGWRLPLLMIGATRKHICVEYHVTTDSFYALSMNGSPTVE